ncbi:MAG: hypothetical protein CMI54_02385 [Parcubacteria group bacterium]|jgi:hypothetical protein|nr:hypothetical protein [Parcubacteria group bacterium]|tara:strand:+ start:23045 stop:24199 length:1155 start_codon:yes stop_codon:yes gene_type:complete
MLIVITTGKNERDVMAQDIKGIAIFATGTWNYMKFVEEDLQEIADNTNKLLIDGSHKPPIKLGHSDDSYYEPDEEVGQPALGYIENLRVEDGKLLADFIDVPDVVILAIEANLYSQISVEMDFIRFYGWILTGVAILGSDLPAVKTLEDLRTYLTDNTISGTPAQTEISLNFSDPIFNKKDFIMDGIKEVTPTVPTSPQEVVVKHDFAAQPQQMADAEKEELRQLREEKAANKAQLKLLEDENKNFKQTALDAQFSERKNAFLATYEKHVSEGKLSPAMFEKIKSSLESQKAQFMEGKEFSLSPELFNDLAESYANPLTKGEHASNQEEGSEVAEDEKFVQKIYETMSQTGKGYTECTTIVQNAHPKLFMGYNNYRIAVAEGRI